MAATEILYVSYNGIGEPLVASQVLAYLRGLGAEGFRFTLLTYERRPLDAPTIARWRERLAADAIVWRPVQGRRGPAGVATLVDLWRGRRAIARVVRRRPIVLLHARSFVPAVLAWRAKTRHGVPFVNDLRGFWIDEKVYKGSIAAHGWAYALGKRVEASVLRASDAIVSLSERGIDALRGFACFRDRALPPVVTIPTCVDLARFRGGDTGREAMPVFGYVGVLGEDHLPDRVLQLFRAALVRFPGARLHLVTRTDPATLWPLVDRTGVGRARGARGAAPPAPRPPPMQAFDVGLSLIRPHFAKLASCPTKLGEYLAAGVPVIANSGIGDVDALFRAHRVGCLLPDFAPESIDAALAQLATLLREPDRAARCRDAAEQVFSLQRGVAGYAAVYRQVLASRREANG